MLTKLPIWFSLTCPKKKKVGIKTTLNYTVSHKLIILMPFHSLLDQIRSRFHLYFSTLPLPFPNFHRVLIGTSKRSDLVLSNHTADGCNKRLWSILFHWNPLYFILIWSSRIGKVRIFCLWFFIFGSKWGRQFDVLGIVAGATH